MNQLLKTKLHIPKPRPSLVPRPRLIEQLNAGVNRRVTLLSAPAGFGKTTLLSEWAQQSKMPVAWLALDEADNDLPRMLSYLIAALQTVHPSIGESVLATLRSRQTPPVESLLTDLLNEITDTDRNSALVLDDFHVIENEPVHNALAFVIDHLPPQLHLILATRADPPLPLARLRARAQLAELRQSDLRFTLDEAAQFLKQIIGHELSTDHIAALTARTEGWAAGLQMAAVSMQSRDDIAGFIAAFTGSQHFILDYLVEEVLQRQPENVQQFLLETCILDRMSAPLCDAVTGASSSQAMLERLEHANLFVIPLDESRQWYRYHRLFADLLNQRLQQTQSDILPGLHRRASEWCEANGLSADAISHALSAKDFSRAAHLIEQNAEATLMRGEVIMLLKWMDTLPDDHTRARPTLCIYHAAALVLRGRPAAQIRKRLEDAAQAEVGDQLPGGLLAFHAWMASARGDTRTAFELSRRAKELLPKESAFMYSMLLASQAMAHLWEGDVDAAFQSFEECVVLSQRSGNLLVSVLALRRLAQLCTMQGRLREAKAYADQALELGHDVQGKLLPLASAALRELGKLAWEWNDLETATRYFAESIELSQPTGIWSGSGQLYLAFIRGSQGDLEGALEMLKQARQMARDFDIIEWDEWAVALYEARFWLMQGNVDMAARVLESGQRYKPTNWDESQDPTRHLLRRTEKTVEAQLALARHRPDTAMSLLDPLLVSAEAARLNGFVIEIQILRALAFHARRETAQAMAALQRALTLAEPEGYVRTFINAGEGMKSLIADCRLEIEKHASSMDDKKVRRLLDYTTKLLDAFRESPSGVTPVLRVETRKSEVLAEPLSARELEVLQLLQAGLSNKAIARRLVIADETVKKHLKNIYGKLGVHSRTEATARGRELSLL